MERLSWKDMRLFTQTSPDVISGMPDYISMKGALDIVVPRGKPLPDKLYQMTLDIESKLKRAYPNLRFVGKETLNEIDSQCPGTRYSGQIYGANEQGVITRIQMSAFETRYPFELETLLTFFSVFPLGEYRMQTQQALSGIWQHISCFDYVCPEPSTEIPFERQGDQSIVLVRKGKPIATGQHAIKQSGMSVEPKKTILMCDGIHI